VDYRNGGAICDSTHPCHGSAVAPEDAAAYCPVDMAQPGDLAVPTDGGAAD
jgi:hypothetical protein